MRILYLNHYAGSPEMGMEFRPYYLSREWVKTGHEVTIVAGDYSHLRRINPSVEHDFQEERIDGITYCWVRTGSYDGNGAARAMSMFRFVGKVHRDARMLCQRYRPDVVIASSTYPLDTWAAQRIRKISGAKYVHEVHDMWPATLYEVGGMPKSHPFVRLLQAAEDSAYRQCDLLVSLLPYAKDYMVEHGLDPKKFVNIQNGVDLETWDAAEPLPGRHRKVLAALQDKFIVGYFGGHAVSNALGRMLDAAEAEDDPEVAFVLVGDGVEKPRLEARAREMGLTNVSFLPPVPKSCVPLLLSSIDCAYMGGADSPLYRFGLSLNKMYDAMMGGVPIICAYDAPKTLVQEHLCGVQVAPEPVENIVEAIDLLKSFTAAERRAIGIRGRDAVLQNYTYNVLATAFMDAVNGC